MRQLWPEPSPIRRWAGKVVTLSVGMLLTGAAVLGLGRSLGWTSLGGQRDAQPAIGRTDASSLLPGASWIATASVAEVAVYADPDDAEPVHRLASPDDNGTSLVFLVDGADADGAWLPVLLPVRPNGAKGWIRRDDVEVAQTQYRVEVELAARRLRVTRGDEVVIESPIGVGKDGTPTPGGRFYVKELIQPPTPDTIYGPYVFGLSGFSNVLTSFAGDSEAVIGIHGNNDPSSIGQSVSHGCIRLPNDVVTRLTELIPLGTPVEIIA